MKNYLALVPKYLSAHKKKARLAIVSVAISVALITGVFSMLDVFLQFERLQVIKDYGNYHLAITDVSKKEISSIKSRIDVQNSGEWLTLNNGVINMTPCKLGALDEAFAENMNIRVIKGTYPTEKNEIMLEQWATDRLHLNVNIGDRVQISFSNDVNGEFIVSGLYNDFGNTKAAGVPGVFLSINGANEIGAQKTKVYLIEFKKKVKIYDAVQDIKQVLNINQDRIHLNDRLLAVMGQSKHQGAIGLYTIGAVLFCLVLLAGVVMIYNTFNISVMERVRQFGLLRCIGASQSQIKRLVMKEGLIITLRAIPLGILVGMLITIACSAILKYFNSSLFGDLPLFNISLGGIAAGVLIGFLTVFMAAFWPAQKAAQVSPINAMMASNEMKTSKTKKQGGLTKFLAAEVAMGINNAVIKKKTLFLMSGSIAISIIMFLGFNVFIDFMHTSLKTTKPYTPDISIRSEQGISDGLYTRLSQINGVKRVYGRRLGYVDATFKAVRLTDTYNEMMQDIKVRDNGLFVPPEKSWLISYDQNQLKWAEADLIDGEISVDKLNEKDGVIAVATTLRNNISAETANLQIGDKVYFETTAGTKEYTVTGILRTVPFSSKELTLTTFITTERLFKEITGKSTYEAVDIQLNSKNHQEAVVTIKDMVDNDINFLDMRQQNAEIDQTFLTMAVFVYGFVAVIALISILNIINTMNTSVVSKIRYLGVMRAIGMSGKQVGTMVLVEAATYSVTGCLAGCILGIVLQKQLIINYLVSFKIIWKFPLEQIIIILIIALAMTVFSVIRPLKRIRDKSISEIVNSL